MDDTISRQAAIDAVRSYMADNEITDSDWHADGIAYEIKRLPSAQRTGRWIYVEEEYCWCCSSCKTMMAEFESKPVWIYCPNCGARMEEE